MQKRNWFRYLDFWCNQKVPIGSGLSIPFLIGIELISNKDYDIETFLFELKKTKINQQVICLRYCPNINEIVCCLDTMENSEKKFYNNFDNLYYSITEFNDTNDFKIFKSMLIEKYKEIIENQLFSKENGNWISFSEKKIEEIKLQIC